MKAANAVPVAVADAVPAEAVKRKRPHRGDGPQHRIKPIYLFEIGVRAWLVTTPRVLAKRVPSFNRTISLIFM